MVTFDLFGWVGDSGFGCEYTCWNVVGEKHERRQRNSNEQEQYLWSNFSLVGLNSCRAQWRRTAETESQRRERVGCGWRKQSPSFLYLLEKKTKTSSTRRMEQKMTEMWKEQPSHWWWLDTHSTTKRSPWLQSTLTDLNEKTKSMLKLIEADADSFAQRAEMYYKKRPQLISMVEDFYRRHRSLAERYDQVKSDVGTRLMNTWGAPLSSAKYQSEKSFCFTDRSYDSFSDNCDVEDSAESEVDDPELEEETKSDNSTKEEGVPFVRVNDEVMVMREEVERLREENRTQKDQLNQKDSVNDEVMRLRTEIEKLREENMSQKYQLKQKDGLDDKVISLSKDIERLREENSAQKDKLNQKDAAIGEVMRLSKEMERLREEKSELKCQLMQKDEEKKEAIRHLSLAIDMLKQENMRMRNFIAKDSTNKRKNPFEFNKIIGSLSGKLFNGWSSWNQPSVVAL
ncbi:hypothetical protein L6164_034629 [Bauhinia variegata]|uniref:Uncharacterized protein n=1 Tax=Bauhinia variegata TaxID=167791 RepID=A0ACB9KVL8_BAUVA|nr:hypothetical protein L6164_034629 [Bauhinia variegata]